MLDIKFVRKKNETLYNAKKVICLIVHNVDSNNDKWMFPLDDQA